MNLFACFPQYINGKKLTSLNGYVVLQIKLERERKKNLPAGRLFLDPSSSTNNGENRLWLARTHEKTNNKIKNCIM